MPGKPEEKESTLGRLAEVLSELEPEAALVPAKPDIPSDTAPDQPSAPEPEEPGHGSGPPKP